MKKRHWICDCPEGWIYPIEIPVCQHCFLMSPKEIMSKVTTLRGRKFWSKLDLNQRRKVLEKFIHSKNKRKA